MVWRKERERDLQMSRVEMGRRRRMDSCRLRGSLSQSESEDDAMAGRPRLCVCVLWALGSINPEGQAFL